MTDALSQSDTQPLSIVVSAALAITTTLLTECQSRQVLQPDASALGRRFAVYLVGHTSTANRAQPEHFNRGDYRHSGGRHGRGV